MNDIEASIKYGAQIADLNTRIEKQSKLIIAQTGQLAVKDGLIDSLKKQLGDVTKERDDLKKLGGNKIERQHHSSTVKAHNRSFRSWYPDQYPKA